MLGSSSPLGRILVAEDNPGDVFLLRQALLEHSIPCELDVARDGEEAVRFLGRVAESDAGRPRMIILDLNLPKVHGLEVLESVKRNPAFTGVPVIILTSSLSIKDKQQAEMLGADLYITKPSNLNDFMAIGKTLRELLPISYG
jgi:CheY-like chemotaxis protein